MQTSTRHGIYIHFITVFNLANPNKNWAHLCDPHKIADLGFCLAHVCLRQLPAGNLQSNSSSISLAFCYFYFLSLSKLFLFLSFPQTAAIFLSIFFHNFFSFTIAFNLASAPQSVFVQRQTDNACAWWTVYLTRTLFVLYTAATTTELLVFWAHWEHKPAVGSGRTKLRQNETAVRHIFKVIATRHKLCSTECTETSF